MLQPVSRRLFAFALAAMLFAASAPAQDYKSFQGSWSMTSETNDDPVHWTLVLKDIQGKLDASITTPDGNIPAKDVSYANGLLKFKAPYQDYDYDVELKVVDGKLAGTWSGNGNSGKTSGTKI